MKYLLVFSLILIVVSKSAVRDESNPTAMAGVAKNQKTGAVLSSPDGVCLIAGLRSWDSIYLDKRVKITGNFKLKIWENEHPLNEDSIVNALQPQIYLGYYLVTNATWELYEGK